MADQPKKKVGQKNRNDERKNGKAFKRPDATRNRKTSLDDVQKVLLGGGLLRNTNKTTKVADPWRGVEGNPAPWNPEQAKENRLLYPHLFTGR